MSWKRAPWLTAAGRKPSFGPGRVRERRGLRPVGQSRSHMLRRYANARKRWLAGKACAVFPEKRAVHVHHMRGRVGALLLDERYWLPVSWAGHRWIHDNPGRARRMGWLAQRGQWGKADA